MLVEAGHEVKSIDISPVMVAAARERVPGAVFEEGDARSFEPPGEEKGKLDAVTAFSSFIAGVSHADIINLPKRVHDWVKSGGLFVSGWVIPPNLMAEILEHKWIGYDVVVSILPNEELTDVINDAGFDIADAVEAVYKPKATELDICKDGEVWEKPQLFICARRK